MKFTMTKIAAATVLAMASTSALAVPVAAESMYAATGTFLLGTGLPDGGNPWNFAASTTNLIGAINQSFGSSFTYFGSPVGIYVSNGTYAPTDTPVVGGAPISAMLDATAGTITADMSAWTAYWGGTNFNQGSANATGTYDGTTGAFTVSWQSTVVGGVFNGVTGYWSLTGVVGLLDWEPDPDPVVSIPEASTYAMMLTGLGLVGFMARRRKQAAI